MKFESRNKIISIALLGSICLYSMPVFAYTKDETVYSKINNKGDNYKTVVSTFLQNTENEELIQDMTDLINIKNAHGEEKFTQEGNKLLWNSNKNDIYYQGETKKELPIKINTKYFLNDKEIEASEIVGKDGKVKIIIEYCNNDKHNVKVNGKLETLYTPFVVLAGTIIDNEKNRNIEITNGKVINDGSRTLAIGMAMPGLQESLGMSKETIDIPSSIEIKMDAKDFEMNSIINVVNPKVLEENDIEKFDKIEKIYNEASLLKSTSAQIENGAIKLKEGSKEYSEKMKEFNGAIDQITKGMENANNSYTKINQGLKEVSDNDVIIDDGARQVYNGIELVGKNLNTINQKMSEIKTGSTSLKNGELELNTGIEKIIAGLEKIPVVDNQKKINDLTKLINGNKQAIENLKQANQGLNAKLQIQNLMPKEKENLKVQIEGNKNIINLLEQNTKAEQETIRILKATDSEQLLTLKLGLKQVQEGLLKLIEGTTKLDNGLTALNEGTSILKNKTKDLEKGAKTLYSGTTRMKNATKTLKNGSNSMKEGLNTLDVNGKKIGQANLLLVDGADSLNEGTNQLVEGISKFNKEGIDKIVRYINGDLRNMTEKIKKLQELANNYDNFTMLENGTEGNTKFIMIVDALNKENIKANMAIINRDQEDKNEKD